MFSAIKMAPKKTSKRKSPVRIKVRKEGALSKYGYHSSDSAEVRHRALRKAARGSSPVEIVRRLNAIAVLNKNRKPRMAAKFRADMHWVQKNLYPADKRASPKRKTARKSPKKSAKRASPKRKSPKKSTKKRASPKRKSSTSLITGVSRSLLNAGWRENKSAASRRSALKKLARSGGVSYAYTQVDHARVKSNSAAVRKAANADVSWAYKNLRDGSRKSPKKSVRKSPKKSVRKSLKMVTVRKAYTRADGRRVKAVRVAAGSPKGRKILATRRRK